MIHNEPAFTQIRAFENKGNLARSTATSLMSFSRHGEIYHFDEGRSGEGAVPANHALAHRNDESPAGYSSAGCSPAVPASASPASAILLGCILIAKDFAANGKLSLITVSHSRGSLQTVPRSHFKTPWNSLNHLAERN